MTRENIANTDRKADSPNTSVTKTSGEAVKQLILILYYWLKRSKLEILKFSQFYKCWQLFAHIFWFITPSCVSAKEMNMEKVKVDEKTFRFMMNEDEMATEKLSDGIRRFSADAVKLEKILQAKM